MIRYGRQIVPGHLIIDEQGFYRVESRRSRDDVLPGAVELNLRSLRTQATGTRVVPGAATFEVVVPKTVTIRSAGTVTVEPAYWDDEQHLVYWHTIKEADGELLYEGEGPGTPAAKELDLPKAMNSLLAFLQAAGEAYRYAMAHGTADNLDMWPDHVNEYAYVYLEELAEAEWELNEGAGREGLA